MSDKPKVRKLAPTAQAENNWRSRGKVNTSGHKYPRDFILQQYSPSDSLPIPVPEDILLLYLTASEHPCCVSEGFLHGLGETVNSRKTPHREKKQEKASDSLEEKEEMKKAEESPGTKEKKEGGGHVRHNDVLDLEVKIEEHMKIKEKHEESSESKERLKAKERQKGEEKKEKIKGHEETGEKHKKKHENVWKKHEELAEIEEKKIKHEETGEKHKKKHENVWKKHEELAELEEQKIKHEEERKAEERKHVERKMEEKKHEEREENKKKHEGAGIKGEKHEEVEKKHADHGKKHEDLEKKHEVHPKKHEEHEKKSESHGKHQEKHEHSDKKHDDHTTKSEPERKPEIKPKKPEEKPKKPEEQPKKHKEDLKKSEDEQKVLPDPSLAPSKKSKSNKKITEKPSPAPPTHLIPSFDKSLLLSFTNKGNPFARAMIHTGIKGEDINKLYFPPGDKPYEKVWFYKDPQGAIQGPFSCIEMFTWTLRDCFPETLEISFWNTEFIPMNIYLSNLKKASSGKHITPEKLDVEVAQKESKVPAAKSAWGNFEKNVSCLKDIQEEQAVSKFK